MQINLCVYSMSGCRNKYAILIDTDICILPIFNFIISAFVWFWKLKIVSQVEIWCDLMSLDGAPLETSFLIEICAHNSIKQNNKKSTLSFGSLRLVFFVSLSPVTIEFPPAFPSSLAISYHSVLLSRITAPCTLRVANFTFLVLNHNALHLKFCN